MRTKPHTRGKAPKSKDARRPLHRLVMPRRVVFGSDVDEVVVKQGTRVMTVWMTKGQYARWKSFSAPRSPNDRTGCGSRTCGKSSGREAPSRAYAAASHREPKAPSQNSRRASERERSSPGCTL